MPSYFKFEIHTLYRLFFSGSVEAVTLTLADGEIGVYAHHSAFTAPVICCILRIKDDKGEWKNAFVTEGILEVKDHKTVLLVDAAEWPDEIDRERALKAKKLAEENLESSMMKFEKDRIKKKLKRAELRLKILELK